MEQSSGMLKRVPDPQNPGQLVEATPVRVISGELDANVEVQLIAAEALEEGFELPTAETLQCAELVASTLSELRVCKSDVEIYPTPDGAITVDVFRGPEGGRSSIILLCEGSDRLQCLTHIKEKNDRREVRLEAFPDEFVRRAFKELMEIQ